MGFISRIVDWVSTPYTIYLVLKEPTIARFVKVRAIVGVVLIFGYVVSPIDIIPDFIPFVGWLDDLLIVPLGFALLRKFTPGFDVVERRNKVRKGVKRIIFWTILAMGLALLLFLVEFGLVIYVIVKSIKG
jgi:hypothetical protein